MLRQTKAATNRPRRKDGRLGAWLAKTEVKAFREYAAELRVPDSALALLLILRELRLRRLEELGSYRATVPSDERKYLTATGPGAEVVGELQAHVERLGETLNGALTLLFRAELAERWLDRAMSSVKESD